MIRNERQYKVTSRQREALVNQLAQLGTASAQAWILKATSEALESQIFELDDELAEYDALRAGERAFVLRDLGELPRELVRARIASDLTQKQLADRLGLKEQQVQRYEATDYAGANVGRLNEVMHALGAALSGELTLESGTGDERGLRKTLGTLGLSSDLIKRRIFAVGDTVKVSLPVAAARAARILGVSAEDLVRGKAEIRETVGAFRAYSSANRRSLTAYAKYAEYLAEIVERATPQPYSPLLGIDEIRQELGSDLKDQPLEALLNLCWNHGIPVVPLADSGNFYGACWMFDGRPVIVLKNAVRTPERWAFLLAHEMHHVNSEAGFSIVEQDLDVRDWREQPSELEADAFATRLLLGDSAAAMAEVAADRAEHSAPKLKDAVRDVAEAAGVSVGILADYVAFRVSTPSVNWWPTANRLHTSEEDAWSLARSTLFRNVDLSRVDALDRDILVDGMAP